MASNSYTSANVTPSSDTFREWVDLTNRITYDMEKYVVTTAPAGNSQGAETIGNAHVNGYFGANTVMIFDGVAGATGNATHYGTRAPAANLTFHTNAVFADDGTNTSIIHAQANLHGTNSGIQFTSNSTVSHITINTTADVFESNAIVNRFNSNTDINANVDIDNALTDITSTNLAITGTETNIDSNTVFTANINITSDSEDFNISSDQIKVTGDVSLFQSNATLNDVNSNVDIDNDLTTINAGNTFIGGNSTAGEFNVDSNTVFNANVHAHANRFEVSSNNVILTSNVDLFQTSATLNDINSNVDIDNALTDINTANLHIENGEMNIDSNVVITSTSTNANIAANVDVTGTNLNTSANVAMTGSNVYVTSANVNLTSTGVTIGDANSDLLTVNSNTVLTDKLNVQEDADFDSDVNVDGSVQVDATLTVGNSTVNAHVSTEGNIDTDGTLTVAGASDLNDTLNVSGITTLENSQNSTSNTTGGTRISGGVGIAKSATVGGDLTVHDDIDGKATLTISGASDLNDTLNVAGIATLENVADSTSNTTGGLVVSGGAGIKKSVTVGENATIEGNADITGTLDVTDVTHLKSTANVDGLFRAKSDAHVTGTANVSVRLNVGADVHANTTAVAVGDGSDTEVVIKTDSIEIGNSTVNTSLSTTAVFTDGTLQAEGATDLNSTLAVSGIATFENVANSTSNTTGSVKVAGGVGIEKSIVVGGNATVHGSLDIEENAKLGTDSTDKIEFKGSANTNLVPDLTANSTFSRNLGSSSKKFNVHADDIRTRVLTASGNVQVDSHLTVDASANIGYPFEVSNTTTTAFVIQTTNGGNDREILVGNTVPNTTVAEDRLIVRSAVGNSTVGLLPLHGNNVPLGDATHRWILSANSGNFSGAVTVTDTTQSSSNATGSAKLAGGLGVTKKVYIGQDLVVEAAANIASLLTAKTDVNITQEANTDTLRVRSNSNLEGTLQVAGDLTANSDVTLGNASSDVIKFVGSIGGNSTVGIIPSATGRILGTDTKRFKAAFTTANTSGDITAGADVDITGQANTDTLRVRETAAIAKTLATGNTTVTGFVNATTTIQSGGDVTVGANAGIAGSANVGTNVNITNQANTDTLRVRSTSTFEDATLDFGNSTIYANLSSNSTQVKFETGYVEATDLVITGSASLPEDTTLTASTLGTANLSVTDTAEFTAATSGASIKFGNVNDRLILNFANAVANAHFVPDDTTRDIGTNALRWGEGHFEDLLQVGGSAGIVLSDGGGASQANVTADNIFARDDLVGASSSDRDLKTNLLKIDTAIDKVEELGGYEFEWNSNIGDERIGTKEYGVIAQEVEQILPHAVKINSRGYRTVNYNSLIPLLIEAVKELSGKVEELERKNRREDLDG